jgi:hypothetical protein
MLHFNAYCTQTKAVHIHKILYNIEYNEINSLLVLQYQNAQKSLAAATWSFAIDPNEDANRTLQPHVPIAGLLEAT